MRISRDTISLRRRNRETIFFLTGGTGFIGSHLAVDFLKNGHTVFLLARPRNSLSARQRVDQLLDWFELEPQHRKNLEVVEGSLDTPTFNLSEKDFNRLLRDVDEIIHCASNTSFSERKRAAVERANIDGLRNALNLAADGHCSFFHYVSTAYAAGMKDGICREELVENDAFTNVYEETKCRAERIVSEQCEREGIGFSVYRPSIVYGNSRTGRSTRFSAVYYPIRTILFLRDLYDADIRERGGSKAREMDVMLSGDGSLHLPIRVEVSENGGVNLIPIDYFVDAFMALMEECMDGGIFHIVNRKPVRIEDLIDYTSRLFKIGGMEPCEAGAFIEKPKNALEILFDTYLDVYGPYMRDTRIFEDQKAQAILSRKNVVCPDFDFDVYARCMKYAIECRWGAELFEGQNARRLGGR
ncbi:MAG TPA: SDR family oxidoreductase [Syntrophales bacterium]|nr:SDR family oxidoreductase [Syntrophales bacterium]